MINIVNKLFGTIRSNSLKKYANFVEKVNKLEEEISKLSDQELKELRPPFSSDSFKFTYNTALGANTQQTGDLVTLRYSSSNLVVQPLCSNTETIDETRVVLTCHLPLNEILVDFNDRLKSCLLYTSDAADE